MKGVYIKVSFQKQENLKICFICYSFMVGFYLGCIPTCDYCFTILETDLFFEMNCITRIFHFQIDYIFSCALMENLMRYSEGLICIGQ